jgi:hypothetical protein
LLDVGQKINLSGHGEACKVKLELMSIHKIKFSRHSEVKVHIWKVMSQNWMMWLLSGQCRGVLEGI